MEVIKGYQELKYLINNPVVTLGNFDGVHLGHQKIFTRIKERAKELQGTSLVYTFHPHPLSVLMHERQLFNITTLDEKLKLIEKCGIDIVICEPFTREFSQITAEKFVKEILHQRIGVKEIFVGDDYAFGSKQQGNVYYLLKMGKAFDFRTKIIDSITIDKIIVKSSKIREFIQGGEITAANRLLGRSYNITGQIIRGKERGVLMGFPTANIKPNKILHPGAGVYAVWVHFENQRFPGAMNIGYNPTFDDRELSFEVHILNFNKDIYGKELEICFVERIREEKTFSSPEELVAQMRNDISKVEKILGVNPG